MLIVVIPCQSKMRTPFSHLFDPYTFCLLSTLYYKTCISICKPNHQDLISLLVGKQLSLIQSAPFVFPIHSRFFKDIKWLEKNLLQNQKFLGLSFLLSFFLTVDCTLQPPLLPSSTSLVICAP